MARMLVATSFVPFGIVQLSAGEFMFNEGEAILTDDAQIDEYIKLVESGNCPHLGMKNMEELEAEAAKAAARAAHLAQRAALAANSVKAAAPVVGAASTKNVPDSAVPKEKAE